MKIIRFLILFTALVTSFCFLTTKGFGQCGIKYSHTIQNTSHDTANGQIELSFEATSDVPDFQLFAYTEKIPYLLMEVSRKTDVAKHKVTFYGLSAGDYTIRVNQKGCKPFFIGEHTKIIVGTNQAR
jgi:hypothetical protein